jgi:4,5-DOPA dioxygenase extradiol
MTLKDLSKISESFEPSPLMPVLFLGHGSPMNAIEDNAFSREWKKLGQTLPKPNAIVCVSAHWETPGTFVTAMPKPKTIHDFGGFPKELFAVEYPAPGSLAIAEETKKAITMATVGLDHEWGLDHGCWSVIMHMYPKADIPIIQLSLDYRKDAAYHYELGQQLQSLRKKGVMIIGSGNMVHNLGIMDWKNADGGYEWAVKANDTFKNLISNNDHQALINYSKLGREIQLSIPSPEHYLPLLYILALKNEKEKVTYFNDQEVYGSIAMTSILIC